MVTVDLSRVATCPLRGDTSFLLHLVSLSPCSLVAR